MKLLHNIGNPQTRNPAIKANYNTREEVLACNEPLGFDGIYKNVWENRDILKGKKGVLFVMGNYIGKDNSFDTGMPYEKYCDEQELQDLLDMGFKIGWHTWSHPDLTTLTKEEILKEITPPYPMKYFAYPYGRYNDLVVECVKEVGFEKAYSVTQGNDNPLTLRREYL